MSIPTYTNRLLQVGVVTSLDGGGITFGGWGFGATDEQAAMVSLNETYFVETDRTNAITGMASARPLSGGGFELGRWLWHKSDQDLEGERSAFLERLNQEREQQWAENQEDWHRREALLPGPLKRRLERFRANGGHQFEIEGWGYELTVCELAVLYAASGGNDDAKVTEYGRLHGTSGNQHGFACALAGLLLEVPNDHTADVIANAPSALTPLTGDPDYSGSNR